MLAFVCVILGGFTQLRDGNQEELSTKIFQSNIRVTTELCLSLHSYVIISVHLHTERLGGCQLVSGRVEVRIKGHIFNKDCRMRVIKVRLDLRGRLLPQRRAVLRTTAETYTPNINHSSD